MRILALFIVLAAFTWLFLRVFPASAPVPANGMPRPPAKPGQFSDADRDYYDQIFVYALENLPGDNRYDWEAYSGKGTIYVAPLFKSKSGSGCRNYKEAMNLGGVEYKTGGIACKRQGSDGWCRLKAGSEALTCAMEKSPLLPGVNVPGVNVKTPDVNINTDFGPAPNVNMPAPSGIGSSQSKKPSAGGAADSITGAAGSVAGPITGGALKWFNDFFR